MIEKRTQLNTDSDIVLDEYELHRIWECTFPVLSALMLVIACLYVAAAECRRTTVNKFTPAEW